MKRSPVNSRSWPIERPILPVAQRAPARMPALPAPGRPALQHDGGRPLPAGCELPGAPSLASRSDQKEPRFGIDRLVTNGRRVFGWGWVAHPTKAVETVALRL